MATANPSASIIKDIAQAIVDTDAAPGPGSAGPDDFLRAARAVLVVRRVTAVTEDLDETIAEEAYEQSQAGWDEHALATFLYYRLTGSTFTRALRLTVT